MKQTWSSLSVFSKMCRICYLILLAVMVVGAVVSLVVSLGAAFYAKPFMTLCAVVGTVFIAMAVKGWCDNII
jgi:hypothetical protein